MSIRQQMWTEKYRPETLDEVIGHEAAVDQFERFLEDGGLPHMLLAGPPGVGKTACVIAFGKDLYGDLFEENVNEFNASDDRGIDVIRDDIKEWCRTAPSGGFGFKLVFLDEADALTNEAQNALRRVMEEYADNTRFVLSCNYVNEIKGPIQSRCATMHFQRLNDGDVENAISKIIDAESIEVDDAAVDKIVHAARGQIRDAVMSLQLSTVDGELKEDQVDLFTGVVDDKLVEDILSQALDGEIDTAQQRLDVEILKAGADPNALVDSIFRVLRRLDLPPDQRAKAFELLATVEERIQSGLNPNVQFHALLAHLYMSQGLSPLAHQAGENDE